MALPQLVELDYEKQVMGTAGGHVFVFGGKEVWLPKSATKVDTNHKTVTIPRELAREMGLI